MNILKIENRRKISKIRNTKLYRRNLILKLITVLIFIANFEEQLSKSLSNTFIYSVWQLSNRIS